MNQVEIYTIGHSNHSADRFIALLKDHGIEAMVDVRRFPSSRRLPHFNRPNLARALEEHGIEYHWLESLGGHHVYVGSLVQHGDHSCRIVWHVVIPTALVSDNAAGRSVRPFHGLVPGDPGR